MGKRKKIITLSVVTIVILIIIRLDSPCKLCHIPIFYGPLNSIEEMDIPDSYIQSYNKGDIKEQHEIIECSFAFLNMWEKKAEISFIIYDLNQIDIFNLIVNDISLYMKEHPHSFLNNCKVNIVLEDMDACIIDVHNYNYESINKYPYDFNYCKFSPFDEKLSSLKNYDWVEVLDIDYDVEIDDISPLMNMINLKEIICPPDIFSKYQEKLLTGKHRNIKFTFKKTTQIGDVYKPS